MIGLKDSRFRLSSYALPKPQRRHQRQPCRQLDTDKIDERDLVKRQTPPEPDPDMKQRMQAGPYSPEYRDRPVRLQRTPQKRPATGQEGKPRIADEMDIERPHHRDPRRPVIECLRGHEHVDAKPEIECGNSADQDFHW